MRKILTVGVFDYFHYGHLRLFQRAKEYGDYLIVAVQDGNSILKYKPDAVVCYTTQQRLDMVSALRVVDEVCTYEDVDRTVRELDFDVFVVGGDQKHAGFMRAIQWCRQQGIGVVCLERTPGISSSAIKQQLL